jgi:hypothetical protein
MLLSGTEAMLSGADDMAEELAPPLQPANRERHNMADRINNAFFFMGILL